MTEHNQSGVGDEMLLDKYVEANLDAIVRFEICNNGDLSNDSRCIDNCVDAIVKAITPMLAPSLKRESSGWQPIETAPKGKAIKLWIPEFGNYMPLAWTGCWSYRLSDWVIYAPVHSAEGNGLRISELPHPTHWAELDKAPLPEIEGQKP